MRLLRLVAAAVVVALAASSTAALAAAPSPAPSPRPPRSLDELKSRIAAVIARAHVPGAGIAVVTKDGVVWSGGIGVADLATGAPVTDRTLFRVGSITKTFVALAIVKLVEERRLSLDDSVAGIAPELGIENPWQREQPITVAHLLEHTAGFDECHPSEGYGPLSIESLPLRALLDKNPRSRRARWRPGSRASYSNPGYSVAAYVVEKVTGRAWDDYVRAALFTPLGVRDSALRWSADVDARLARGYGPAGDAPLPYRAIYHQPSGNLMTSARDLAEVVRLFIRRGRVGERALVGAESIARMERSGTLDLRGTDADYGFANLGDIFVKSPMRGHDGGIDGYLSAYEYDVARGVGFAFMINRTSEEAGRASFEIRQLLASYVLAADPVLPPPRVEVPIEALRRWEGSYALANPRNQLFAFLQRIELAVDLRVEMGALQFRRWPGDFPQLALVAVAPDKLRFPFASGSHVQLGHDRDGRRVVSLHGGLAYFVEEPRWKAPLYYYGARAVIWLMLSTVALGIAAARRRRDVVAVGWVAPLVCAVSFFAIPFVFFAAVERRVVGEPNSYTIAICALTIVFAVASTVNVVLVLLRSRQPLPLALAVHRGLVAVAALAATLFAASYGLIGIRLWLY